MSQAVSRGSLWSRLPQPARSAGPRRAQPTTKTLYYRTGQAQLPFHSGPWSPGSSRPDLSRLEQGTVGKSRSPVKNEGSHQRLSKLCPTFPALPADSPLPPPSHAALSPSPCSQLSPVCPRPAWPPCVPPMPVPRPGRASARLQGSALQWAGRTAAGREGGRGDLAVSE